MIRCLRIASLGLALTSGVFAQSYMVRGNGTAYTVDQKGFVYNMNLFVLPYMVTTKGGQFFTTEKREIVSVDENGFFYRLDPKEFEAPRKVQFSGYNYFAGTDGTVWTFDRQGLIYKGEPNWDYRKPLLSGGTYFVVSGGRNKPGRLIVATDRGQLVETVVPNLDPAQIKDGGNNWFQAEDGRLFTLSRDGFVYDKTSFLSRTKLALKGGVYFALGTKLYTVAEDGMVSERGSLSQYGTVTKTGHNYFLTKEGKVYTIDMQGAVYERTSALDFSNVTLTTF